MIMHISIALNYLEAEVKATENWEEKTTLRDIHGVLLRAGTLDGQRWAAKIKDVVAYVKAGNYAFCYPDAKKLLNKRSYKIASEEEKS